MALPTEVQKRTVYFGRALDVLGTAAKLTGSIAVDRPLIWLATGDTVFDSYAPVTVAEGEDKLKFEIFAVDQDGWLDRTGQPVKNFEFVFAGKAEFPDRETEYFSKKFQIFSNQDNIDIDLLPPGGSTGATFEQLRYVESVAGLIGVVSAETLAGVLNEYFLPPTWTTLLNKPTIFPPTSHRHNYSDLDNTPTIPSVVGLATTTQVTQASTEDRAYSVQRANHTGTQTSATISDFAEAAQDAVALALRGVTGATVTYNDAANTITIAGVGDPETMRDTIGTALVGLGNITVAVNDTADTITISTLATVNATDAALRDRSTHTGTQSADTVSETLARFWLTAAYKLLLDNATNFAVANALVKRNALGGANFSSISLANAPANPDQAVRKDYVDLANRTMPASVQSADAYTLALPDAGTVVETTSDLAVTVTIPPAANVAFAIGSLVEVHVYGLGQVTLVPGSGVALRSRGGLLKSAGQYSVIGLRYRGLDEWTVTGDLIA